MPGFEDRRQFFAQPMSFAQGRRTLEEQFQHGEFFCCQVFAVTTYEPHRALKDGIFLRFESALEFFHLTLTQVIDSSAVEFGEVEAVGHDFGIRQRFFDCVDEAFVQIGRDLFDLVLQPLGDAFEEGKHSCFLSPLENGQQNGMALLIVGADNRQEIVMAFKPRYFINSQVA